MFDPEKIKGLLFDYGGTIDSNGMHWSEVIWASYEALQIPVGKEAFRQAYIHGERALARNRLVLPHHNFWHVIRLKAEQQLQWLQENGQLTEDEKTGAYVTGIADWCYVYAQTSINAARPLLKKLSEQYPLVLVTNFYGNMEAVLADFYLREFFGSIVESSVVNIRKPDPEIFRLGVKQLGFAPSEIALIGDSYSKDIAPATLIGCRTVWLKKKGWSNHQPQETADAIISDFAELNTIFRLSDRESG
ncbi:MAG: HAD family hydrolase [Tannerellaceae bacterium]|jgi:putative hydrolase of the HAD superfamily|nr:HAD family hydrolase [Tannerellaceae bacterium]